ncbi:hypothetical protein QYF61_018064 [Mycteria americana]|uniref:RNase H type-1 domain-containing protein n=1 Tax=Mycteria americana TaxID=33587 RepID=A0AAN7RYH8_MYCAM|nr:hypothetical protein QYF61_018064 [Mycteria americana]
MAGWCRLWIYNYGIVAKALYELLKNNPTQPLRSSEAQNALKTLKKEPMKALALPDVTKPFWLFSHDKQGIALGVLAQRLGLCKRAVAYFSKQLDKVSKGWPGCLQAVAAVVVNIREARKFTLGQKNHSAGFTHMGLTSESLIHDCLETIETVYSSRADLKEEPSVDAQASRFTDGSSFIRQGIRKAAYAVTTASKGPGIGKREKKSLWTDSKYAFGVVHAHRAIWKERGLLTAPGRQIKHAEEILHPLEAVQLPTKVAITHCRGRPKGNADQEKGHSLADYEANYEAAERIRKILTLIPGNRSRSLGDQENVAYSRADKELIEEMGGQVPFKGWARLSDGRIIIPAKQVRGVVKEHHNKTHWGADSLYQFLHQKLIGRNLYTTV